MAEPETGGALTVTLKGASVDEAGNVINAVTINWGTFVQTALDFLIVAFAIFLLIKVIMRLKKKEEEAPAAPPEPTKEENLLTEIRDLLKK